MDFILVFLQANEPPSASAHGKTCEEQTHDDASYCSYPASSRKTQGHSSTLTHDKGACESEMAMPRNVTKMATKDGEESKDLNRKQSQGEHVGC